MMKLEELCRRLHHLVDELATFDPEWLVIRVTYRNREGLVFTLVVGVEAGEQ